MYNAGGSEPAVVGKINRKVTVDMNELEEEIAEAEAKTSKKKKSAKKTKATTKTPRVTKPKNVKAPTIKTAHLTDATATNRFGNNSSGITSTQIIVKPQADAFLFNNKNERPHADALLIKTKNEREEREYLRSQSHLDLDLETKRASNYFDLAERANRMA